MERSILALAIAAVWLSMPTMRALEAQSGQPPSTPPNIILFVVDDLGYGDLSLTGHPTINTPNIDQLAREGTVLTSFYAAPNCTPARGMLLTGRYPPRTGLIQPFGPGLPFGIKEDEITLAEALKSRGYRNAMFGKWHLGDFEAIPARHPRNHGFETFLGIPYPADYPQTPLFQDMQVVERSVVVEAVTRRLTDESIRFIRSSEGRPFFLYLAHPMPHTPIAASARFQGHSRAGNFGDAVEELDWSLGELMSTLKELRIDQNTIFVFTSDNGPERSQSSSPGLLRGFKASTWEGGIRVPAVIRWPGTIAASRRSAEIVSIMDLYPTLISAAGAALPKDRPIDGLNMMPFLAGGTKSPREEYFYFNSGELEAVRVGPWKLRIVASDGTALFNLDTDPSERRDVAAKHPDIVARLRERIDNGRATIK